eukprot:CAMPEP_0201671072 /NCGR_PEP_ID=MMETSP0494-20130426/28528_1 /ASSEMBLY_ACC=CAM_ASM_000839 /TAXON_ID=420259 /ORGANISM="Thalassiosira gravida, Strain GMp14c1" /LENGTH=311 /DNA_ID=CAMNT_0048152311 /DNA_START=99 /DNA_END=1034 /DNA_ORIENTATION=+
MTSSNDDENITLQLEDSRDVQMHFEVEKSNNLDAVFRQYSKFKGLDTTTDSPFQFSYKGKPINPTDTPTTLGMDEHNNTIQVSLVGEALAKETIARACESGNISTAIDLLSEGDGTLCTQSLDWVDSDGEGFSTPPIFIAIDYGHVELVEKLLVVHEDGVLDTIRNGDNYSPLQWASWTGNLEIVKLLIEKGKVTTDDECLSLSRDENHNEVVEFLLKHVDMYSNLQNDMDDIMEKACREGDISKVRTLLDEEKVDLDKWRDDDGKFLAFSPIYLAMRHGHMDLIQLFAERGVQVDMTDGAAPEAPEVSAE